MIRHTARLTIRIHRTHPHTRRPRQARQHTLRHRLPTAETLAETCIASPAMSAAPSTVKKQGLNPTACIWIKRAKMMWTHLTPRLTDTTHFPNKTRPQLLPSMCGWITTTQSCGNTDVEIMTTKRRQKFLGKLKLENQFPLGKPSWPDRKSTRL